MPLHERKCVPCEGGIPALGKGDIARYLKELDPSWRSAGGKKIERVIIFSSFREAIAFVNRVAKIADEEQHHPDIHVSYNRVALELFTHSIGGLSENDFILAAKIDTVVKS